MTSCRTSILIVDDHPLIREALRGMLLTDFVEASVHCAGSVEEAIQLISALDVVDLVLLDLSLPGHHELSALWTLRERFPHVAVAVFSAHCEQATIRSALTSGARGFLPKHCSPLVIKHALHLMLDGGIYVPVDALPTSHESASPADQEQCMRNVMALPRRQRQIVELVARGLSNKAICRQLSISPNTVKTHLAMAFEALNVHSRYEIVALMHPLSRRDDGSLGGANRPERPTRTAQAAT